MLAMCCEVYEYGTEAVKTASQAAANQTLRAFCHLLGNQSVYFVNVYINTVLSSY